MIGEGWCEEATSCPAISDWAHQTCKFQKVFSIYAQGKSTIQGVDDAAAAASTGENSASNQKARKPNKSDLEYVELGNLLNERLGQSTFFYTSIHPIRVTGADPLFLVEIFGKKKDLRFPRGVHPQKVLQESGYLVRFERKQSEALMTDAEFKKGFEGMATEGRRKWLADVKSGAFKIVPEDPKSSGAEKHEQDRECEGEGSGTKMQLE